MMKSNFQSFEALQLWERDIQYFIIEYIRSLKEKKWMFFQSQNMVKREKTLLKS